VNDAVSSAGALKVRMQRVHWNLSSVEIRGGRFRIKLRLRKRMVQWVPLHVRDEQQRIPARQIAHRLHEVGPFRRIVTIYDITRHHEIRMIRKAERF